MKCHPDNAFPARSPRLQMLNFQKRPANYNCTKSSSENHERLISIFCVPFMIVSYNLIFLCWKIACILHDLNKKSIGLTCELFSYLLCLDECERIFLPNIKTKVWIFPSFRFQKSSTLSLGRLNNVHGNSQVKLSNSIPKDPSGGHHYFHTGKSITNLANVEKRAGQERLQVFQADWQAVTLYFRQPQSWSWWEQSHI